MLKKHFTFTMFGYIFQNNFKKYINLKYVTMQFFQQTLLGTELTFPDLGWHTRDCIPVTVLNR